jgi:uncharacterized OsmC-like protein
MVTIDQSVNGGAFYAAVRREASGKPVAPGGFPRSCDELVEKLTMKAQELRDLQAPLKSRYREAPEAAVITLRAKGELGSEAITCKVETGRAIAEAGLHPATGGDGLALCSGDMLLEALVACAGVTMKAVATALDLPLKGGTVSAEGDLDFRGTLGVAKEVPVGFREIRLTFDVDCDATPEQIDTLLKLTERYCVVYQTLNKRPQMTIGHRLTRS